MTLFRRQVLEMRDRETTIKFGHTTARQKKLNRKFLLELSVTTSREIWPSVVIAKYIIPKRNAQKRSKKFAWQFPLWDLHRPEIVHVASCSVPVAGST